MPPSTLISSSPTLQAYAEKTPTSAVLYRRARTTFPSGITHDVRFLLPHPLSVDRADAGRKWDVDGNEYVDYFGGHGALMLGHNYPAVVEAVREQAGRGVHYGASHELELEWGELVCSLLPSAERIRFTVTGTEATHLALRLARASTGKPKMVRFWTHFHGWHDHVAFARGKAETAPEGILPEVIESMLVAPPGDISYLENLFAARDDIAGVILEPTGSTFGKVPINPQFLTDLRALTERHGVVLIFDEVITGFRCSPGGAQAFYGVTPDLTTIAKILGGGYPTGAVAGRADIMNVMEFQASEAGIAGPRVPHQGTYNAGPVSAAAGLATLKLLRSGDFIERANRTTQTLRREMNGVLSKMGADWCVYGEFSGFHIFTNPAHEAVGPDDIQAGRVDSSKLKGASPELIHKMRAGSLCGGADMMPWPGGVVSGVHDDADVEWTISAFETMVRMLAEEGELA